MGFVIAIDGPAASGKGTLARLLAQKYGLPHLDTGLTYRALAKALMNRGLALEDETGAVKAAKTVDLAKLDREILSTNEVGEGASKVAVIPAVRRVLVEKQRDFAGQPGGAVLDGRDVGTVVCPHADVKLYVTASAAVRAKRRFEEELLRLGDADFETILEDIERRDARDRGRTDSPLKPAQDAHLLDTSNMDIETAFRAAVSIIDQKLASRGK